MCRGCLCGSPREYASSPSQTAICIYTHRSLTVRVAMHEESQHSTSVWVLERRNIYNLFLCSVVSLLAVLRQLRFRVLHNSLGCLVRGPITYLHQVVDHCRCFTNNQTRVVRELADSVRTKRLSLMRQPDKTISEEFKLYTKTKLPLPYGVRFEDHM